MKRFCVRCGKETEGLISSLCTDCYLQKHSVLDFPERIYVDYDRRSGRVRLGRNWIERSGKVLEEMVADKVVSLASPKKLALKDLSVSIGGGGDEGSEAIAVVSFSTDIDGVPLPVRREIAIKFRNTISDASMKISSYYHEAIIQVRLPKKTPEQAGREKLREVLGLLREHKKKIELSEAIDTKNVRGGFDVLVGSSKAAKHVAVQLGKKYKIRPIYSNKMIGMNDNGTTKYRHTYCLKFS